MVKKWCSKWNKKTIILPDCSGTGKTAVFSVKKNCIFVYMATLQQHSGALLFFSVH
jgi:hypothetical protein